MSRCALSSTGPLQPFTGWRIRVESQIKAGFALAELMGPSLLVAEKECEGDN